MPVLLKYGALAVRAFRDYNDEAADLSRQYGAFVIPYLGLYGNKALQLAKYGRIGAALLPVIPEEMWQAEEQTFRLSRLYLSLLWRHPEQFHEYIGSLGPAIFSLHPFYMQLVFWVLVVMCLLYVVRGLYKLLRMIFIGPV